MVRFTGVPFPRHYLESVFRLCHLRRPLCLLECAGVDAAGKSFPRQFPLLPRLGQGHFRIGAKGQHLLFPLKAIFQPPVFPALRVDQIDTCRRHPLICTISLWAWRSLLLSSERGMSVTFWGYIFRVGAHCPENIPLIPPDVNTSCRMPSDSRYKKSPVFRGFPYCVGLPWNVTWWRRGESNPRPKILYSGPLRAFPVIWVSSPGTLAGKVPFGPSREKARPSAPREEASGYPVRVTS